MWTTRIRNVLGDDEASTTSTMTGLVMSVMLIGLAAAVTVGVLTHRSWMRQALMALGAVTVGVWLVRATDIVVSDHGAAFKIVHVVLALISIALAFATWPRRRVPA